MFFKSTCFFGPMRSRHVSCFVSLQMKNLNGTWHVIQDTSLLRLDEWTDSICIHHSIPSCLLISILRRLNRTSVTHKKRWRTCGMIWSIGIMGKRGAGTQLNLLPFGFLRRALISAMVRAPCSGWVIDHSFAISFMPFKWWVCALYICVRTSSRLNATIARNFRSLPRNYSTGNVMPLTSMDVSLCASSQISDSAVFNVSYPSIALIITIVWLLPLGDFARSPSFSRVKVKFIRFNFLQTLVPSPESVSTFASFLVAEESC